MPPDGAPHRSGHLKLLLLVLAVLVAVAQTSPDGWLRRCSYGLGRCRRSCRQEEKKKGLCIGKRDCCLNKNSQLSHFSKNKDTTSELCV
uniref:Defensin beta 115 n=1 Tax=Oryctolagus cuniculus TaxID=9986 RepID=G1U9I4_RABIT